MSNDDESIKLKVLGLISVDESPANLRDIASEYKLPYSKLIKWRKELKQSVEDGDMAILLDADQIMLHRVAEETKRELEELGGNVECDVDGVIVAVDNLGVLNDRMQTTALRLATQINSLSLTGIDARELQSLTQSLCAIQMAFFNKQTTQVNVQNNTYTSDEVSKFKGLKRS